MVGSTVSVPAAGASEGADLNLDDGSHVALVAQSRAGATALDSHAPDNARCHVHFAIFDCKGPVFFRGARLHEINLSEVHIAFSNS